MRGTGKSSPAQTPRRHRWPPGRTGALFLSVKSCASALPQKICAVIRRWKVIGDRTIGVTCHELTDTWLLRIHQFVRRALPQQLPITHYINVIGNARGLCRSEEHTSELQSHHDLV